MATAECVVSSFSPGNLQCVLARQSPENVDHGSRNAFHFLQLRPLCHRKVNCNRLRRTSVPCHLCKGWSSQGAYARQNTITASLTDNQASSEEWPGPCQSSWVQEIRTWAAALTLALVVSLESAIVAPEPTSALIDGGQVQEAIIDGANVIPPGRQEALEAEISALERQTGWKIRVVTRYAQGSYPNADEIRATWDLDERTVLVMEDVTSPNILNFRAGDAIVRQKLPRQFFLELQSRFGNQFFVREEGELAALTQTVGTLRDCLQKDGGCRFVPGLTPDLYYITLITSIIGGAVFGFAARQESTDRIAYSWQWILLFSPLWGILLFSFGTLPVVSRTPELEPLVKNYIGFLFGAAAMYLTPILGTTNLPSWPSSATEKGPSKARGTIERDAAVVPPKSSPDKPEDDIKDPRS